jgi:hypothetical protein
VTSVRSLLDFILIASPLWYDDPKNRVEDDAAEGSTQGEYGVSYSYCGRIDIEVVGNTAADTSENSVV